MNQTATIVWVPPVLGQVVVAEAASPGNVLNVKVLLDGDGRALYQVSRHDTSVIAPSRLGFILADQPKLERNFELASAETSSFDETWEQPWGERRLTRNAYTQLIVHLKEKGDYGRRIDVIFRLYDDGLGFRYHFPEQPGLKTVKITEELTEFDVAEPATAWWIPAGEWHDLEYLYNRTPLSEVSQAHTPLTVKMQSGLHIAFHEAALIDFPAMRLRRSLSQMLKAQLAPAPNGPSAVREAPFSTPWRTLQIAEDAGGLYMSDLVLNLNEPNALGDVSWVKPCKYIGIWWGMHIGTATWCSGPKHGATTEKAKRYIDFAADNGFGGVLIEGWNKGWDGNWLTGFDFDFTTAYPDFDLESVAAYAKSKGVRIVGHHETAGNIAVYEPQLPAALDLYARLGVDSIKTGYVADGGGIRTRDKAGNIVYVWHDSQIMARHHLMVVREAAKRRIAINSHEPIKDTGLRRTYPNWISREGARGMEYNAWGNPPNPPEHETNLVFTRMLSGPMDFTPGILSLMGNGQPINSTKAKQLALYVILYSPVQMTADTIEHYAQEKQALQFIRDVPADWEDTRVLNGEIGDYVTMARKDRHSADWYVGAITDENARTLSADLDFLETGHSYEAQIYKDGPEATFATDARHNMTIGKRIVTAADRLELNLAPGGGQAIRLRRLL